MRNSLLALAVLLGPAPQEEPLLLRLDASALADGPLAEWPNAGSLGGSFRPGESAAPRVETVEGRRAVTFAGRAGLVSTFPLPARLDGAAEFTLIVRAFDRDPAANETLVSLAPRPAGFAELRWDEFAGEGVPRSVLRRGMPAAGRWHHLACTYGGGSVRVLVDGDPILEKRAQLRTKAGSPVRIGASWDSRKEVSLGALAGSIADVRLYGRAWSVREVRNDLGLQGAFAPHPLPGATLEDPRVTLRWERGAAEGRSFRLHLDGTPRTVQTAAELELGPADLQIGRAYTWRVDTLDSAGEARWPGETWNFAVSAGPARNPRPLHRLGGAPRGTRELRWTPGKYAVRQDVFFGAREGELRLLAGALGPDVERLEIPPVEPGRSYAWRVDSDNGDRPRAPGEVWTFRIEDAPVRNDLTFFVASDPHFGLSPETDDINRATIDDMHALPGSRFPEKAGGGLIPSPRGVLITGDLVEHGNGPDAETQWAAFEACYGLERSGHLQFPVFEGVGNHDGNVDRPPRKGVRARNARRPGLRKVSADGLHYSWDWDDVHFICMNLYVGSKASPEQAKRGSWTDPERSLEFLKTDLEECVGKSGRPIVLYHHYGFDGYSNGWYAEEERAAYAEAIRGYAVIAIFYGHTHGSGALKWRGVETFNAPAAQPTPGRYLAVRITPEKMVVSERRAGGWGMSWSVPLDVPLLKPGGRKED